MIKTLNGLIRRSWPVYLFFADIVIFVVIMLMIGVAFSVALESGTSTNDRRLFIVGLAGLVLSLPTVYVSTIRSYYTKARIAAFIDEQWSSPMLEKDTGSWFYRLRIENYGLAKAHNCVGRLLEVRTADGKKLQKFDPLNLYWARQAKDDGNEATTYSPIDIQGYGDSDFLDLAQVKGTELTLRVVLPSPMTLKKEPDTSPSPGDKPILKLPGKYYVRVGIFADNAHLQPALYEISCSKECTQENTGMSSPCRIRKVKRP